MSNKSLLSIERKNVQELFEKNDSLFLIPDYQRPYAWTEEECTVLWEDLSSFALPENGVFDPKLEYFLGSIVVFKNHDEKFEIIDGQQRLITLLLMLRAFYFTLSEIETSSNLSLLDDKEIVSDVRKNIGKCIWHTNEYGKPYRDQLKIESRVATEETTGELINILCNGVINNDSKSRYAQNYKFYQDKIRDLMNSSDNFNWLDLPNRILNNCVLFPIIAGNRDTALRIFSTLNDRGKPLADSDIFKVQLYKAFSAHGKKENFIEQWKELEDICAKMFPSDSPMDELFNRYMYYERAKEGSKNSTLIGIRSFYERDNYRLLRDDHERVFKNLVMLADFWYSVFTQNEERFSQRTLKKLFVLNYAPNAMWTFIVSVYFLHNQDSFDDNKFCDFLDRLTAFIWAFTIQNGGSSTNRLRPPLYKEMINIVNDKELTFSDYKFKFEELDSSLKKYNFSGQAGITRSMLAWWTMNYNGQGLLPLAEDLDIEHISTSGKLVNKDRYKMLGNQSLLEGKLQNSAAKFDFPNKIRYYTKSQIREILDIAVNSKNFNVKEIQQRTKKIFESFMEFVRENGLLVY
ncbi:MAG: DUF262 domain-containing protein [Synergistaceae bacterium]|nr:DUF262 domain-containing protein [Synergistaceae bacterium]